MIKKAKDFFNQSENEKIKNAVIQAEKTTAGEIAIMVVDESDTYNEALTFGAFILSSFLALITTSIIAVLMNYKSMWLHNSSEYIYTLSSLAFSHSSIWVYIPSVFILFFPVRLLLQKLPGIKLVFVPKDREAEAVRERAIRAFYEKGLYKTRDETGILLFISILERKVWILGDKGINSKIDAKFWELRAAELSKGIQEKDYCNAVCATIAKCGEELTKHFPIKPGDTNELTNEVIS